MMIKKTLILLFLLNIHHISGSNHSQPKNASIASTGNASDPLKSHHPEKHGTKPLTKKKTGGLLTQLRGLMIHQDVVKEPLSAYLIPSRDAHYSEYLAPGDERRAFISGFDGPVGDALVTASKALMWTDSRYHYQAAAQMDDHWTLMKLGVHGTPTQAEWINREMGKGSVIGVDPRLITTDEWSKLQKELTSAGNRLIAVDVNLVDLIWVERPQAPANPVKELALEFAGKSTAEKLVDVRKELEKQGAHYLVVSQLDEVAWLLNWRGSDIPYNPVFFSYVIVGRNSLDVFMHHRKATDGLMQLLYSLSKQEKSAKFYDYLIIRQMLEKLVEDTEGKFWLGKYSSYYLTSVVPESRRIVKLTPIALMKAAKNPGEIKGIKNCHIRDAAALCQFFAWVDKALHGGEVVTEVVASKKIKEFRSKLPNFVGPSFPTVAASGPNGALPHYNTEMAAASRHLSVKEIFLLDSGGQYLDGVTDITRSVHFGTPTPFQKECYTKVLKGQIQLVNAVFPNKLVGNYMDGFSRQVLTNVGLENLHGFSHAIGSYLHTHEVPLGKSFKVFQDDPGLQENTFMSIEPGYYQENEFGIRLENMVKVVNASVKYHLWEKGYLTFDDVTMMPFQQKMIEFSMLSPAEIQYVNYFHKESRQKVGDFMKSIGIPESDPGYVWLMKDTEPI